MKQVAERQKDVRGLRNKGVTRCPAGQKDGTAVDWSMWGEWFQLLNCGDSLLFFMIVNDESLDDITLVFISFFSTLQAKQ